MHSTLYTAFHLIVWSSLRLAERLNTYMLILYMNMWCNKQCQNRQLHHNVIDTCYGLCRSIVAGCHQCVWPNATATWHWSGFVATGDGDTIGGNMCQEKSRNQVLHGIIIINRHMGSIGAVYGICLIQNHVFFGAMGWWKEWKKHMTWFQLGQ